jgi:two-component system, NtrC family, response regulator PilR
MNNKALVIDDDRVSLDLLTFQLGSEGFDVQAAETGSEGLEFVKKNDYDIILTDLNLPDINGIELVKRSKEISPETEIIVVTGYDSTESAVEAIRFGAWDYIVKPVDFEKLFVVIRNGVESKRHAILSARQAEEIRELRGRLTSRTSYEGVIGGARSMQNIYEIIENVAESDANILILGESGTGKEVIANAVHYKSHRSNKPFVKVNCSALPKDLIESQLFGHIKGSFTGANSDKVGFIGQANGGSILLDEIGEMPVDLQPKLLRVLQEKVYYRVGSDKPQEADFRLICSTNRDPFEAIRDGVLREDLYYRINTIEIRIPPLRDRMEDVPILQMYAEKYKRPDAAFAQSAYDQMLNHHWRGNVRELQHVIERAVLLSRTGKIENLDIYRNHGQEPLPQSLGSAIMPERSDSPMVMTSAGNGRAFAPATLPNAKLSVEELYQEVGKYLVENLPEPQEGSEQNDVFGGLESGVVAAALKRTKGNKQAAANLLGLYRPRLYGMIKRHHLEEKI